MRRPRSSLVAALLGACLILGACNQGGSTESSETDEPAATATTAAQEPTSSAPGVSVRRRTDSPAPPSPSTSVKEQEAHDITRKNPLSPGPYYIKEIVPGQQVVFEANPHYYKGQPKVKKVVWKIVPSSQIVAALQAGEYDLTVGLNSDLYSKVKDLKNVKLGIQDELSYTYIGFKLGKWDNTKKEVVTDPNAKMADVKLRQAMAYAIDNNQVGEKFYQGLRRNATQLMIPAFKEYYDVIEIGRASCRERV